MERASDAEIAVVARTERRILVTFNADFNAVRDLAPGDPGVIRLRIEPQTVEVVHPVLDRLFRTVDAERFEGALTTVTPHRVRIRKLQE
jgi:predicted nuclease of predicted toxin-antitoxin system